MELRVDVGDMLNERREVAKTSNLSRCVLTKQMILEEAKLLQMVAIPKKQMGILNRGRMPLVGCHIL